MKMHSTKMLPRGLKILANRIPSAAGAIFLSAFLLALLTPSGRIAAAQAAEQTANEPSVTLSDLTPGVVRDGRAMLLNHYEPSNMLRLVVMLKPAHPEEARQYLEDVQTKSSPNFHQFLEPEEWADRFGPSREAEQAVVEWAQKNGFTVTNRYNHRAAVDLEAPAGVIEKALHITINSYQLPEMNGHEARTAFSNDRDPQLPASVAGNVDAVLGLDSVAVLRPAGGSGRVVPQPDYVPGPAVQHMGSAQKDADPDAVRALTARFAAGPEVTPPPAGYFKPTDFFSTTGYDYQALMNQGHCCNPLNNSSGHSPRESSIAIAGFGDVSLNDIAGFHAAFPYLAYNVDKIFIDGGYTCNNSGGFDGNCGEVTMDTEWSLAMANSEGAASDTARVVVYEAPNFGTGSIAALYNQMAADAHARTTSVSFAIVESDGSEFTNSEMQALDSDVFGPMTGEGWTLLGAAGDRGATGGCDDGLRVMFPASDPNFVSVGGTEYNMYASGPEVAWTGNQSVTNDAESCGSNNGGGTGGFSEYFGVPGYQSGMGFPSRSVPDLSLDAFYGHDVYANGGWAHPGGTSVSSPMLAGFFAQANAYLLSIGDKCGSSGNAVCAPIGNANYPVYAEGKSERANAGNQAGHDPFYDTTEGCNSNGLTVQFKLNAYCAKKGYDQATGWGSANMLQLSWAINWELALANGIPNVTFSGPATDKWYNTNQTVTWKINDFSGGSSIPGTGIAGEAQGWDTFPSDPHSEPRGQLYGSTNNFFYSGPQFVNDSTGCLAFVSNGCSALSGSNAQIQGCHTVHVRGWNNQGQTTGGQKSFPEEYGPICYDTIAPATTSSLVDHGLKSVTVTLKATDPGHSAGTGSGVAETYYSINKPSCSATATSNCTVYKKAFTISGVGIHTLLYFSVDKAGNAETVHSKTFDLE
jgi:subtilase family serine protease